MEVNRIDQSMQAEINTCMNMNRNLLLFYNKNKKK